MNYPLISEYIEAIRYAEDNFDELSNLRPVLDGDGNPVMSSGNFAVVFKMTDGKKDYAIKCFTREQEGRVEAYKQISKELEFLSSPFMCGISFFEKELFVDTKNGAETDFPVLQMDWVEGVTLDEHVHRCLNDKYELEKLAFQFCQMAQWLISQPFAHGDLKPDNILVKDDGTLVLVDYDGMFVPAMKGEKARELGSPNYRHPLRTEEQFDEHIDDFALASIALSLQAIALKPDLYKKSGSTEQLLFSEKDYRNLNKSKSLNEIKSISNNKKIKELYNAFLKAYSFKDLSPKHFQIYESNHDNSTALTDYDKYILNQGHELVYSFNRKRLLGLKDNSDLYRKEIEIESGTKTICNNAFCHNQSLQEIIFYETNYRYTNIEGGDIDPLLCLVKPFPFTSFVDLINSPKPMLTLKIPTSIESIGDSAFLDCPFLDKVELPKGLIHIGAGVFAGCNISKMSIMSDRFKPDDVCIIDKTNKSIISCYRSSNKEYTIPSSVKSIGKLAFNKCSGLEKIRMHDNVTSIDDAAFLMCTSLKAVNLPRSMKYIGNRAFSDCQSLKWITIPKSVKNLGDGVFSGCEIKWLNLKSKRFISDGIAIIDKEEKRLVSCYSSYRFFFFKRHQYTIPETVETIGAFAFEGRKYLRTIIIPSTVRTIEAHTFSGCESIRQITIPNSVTSIGDYAFSWCKSLQSINIPNSVTSIGDSAFWACKSLQNITIPNSVTNIGKMAFFWCDSLRHIYIPRFTRSKFENLLPDDKDKLVEIDE